MRSALFALAFISGSVWAQPAQQQTATPEKPAVQQPSAAAGGTGRLFAYDGAEAQRLFRELDRNGDGYLSPDELAADPSNQGNWAAVDRNGDGRIAPSEFTVIKKP
jgi:hypothetical protein